MSPIVAFIKLGRPLFLGGGFLLFALGAAIAAATGHAVSPLRYALGQLAVTSFQLMTHYANDYFDYDTDVANATPTQWSGGSRVLPDGLLSPSVALKAARVLATIGVVATFLLVEVGAGCLTAPTLLLVYALAWMYSAPPARLCARGLGELDTALVVTVLVPWLGYYLQAPSLIGHVELVLTIVPLALLQFAMLLALEFPDRAGDAATGKRTLVVLLGSERAALLYAVVTASAFGWPLVALVAGLPARVALAMMLPAPFSLWRCWRVLRLREHTDRDAFERLTFGAVALIGVTAICALVAWLSL